MTMGHAPAAVKPKSDVKGGFALLKGGLYLAEGLASAYHIGRAAWSIGQAAAPYLALAAAA